MPLQNRVDPLGRIVAVPQRGTLTGNRGILHDDAGLIVRSHTTKAWITCVLEWRGVRRQVMTGRKWTELFFLDEATALAAGHRPCAYCRRNSYNAFVAAWCAGNPTLAPLTRRRAPVVDAVLHRERRDQDGSKRIAVVEAHDLPPGAIYLDASATPMLAAESGAARAWTFAGYGPRQRRHRSAVNLLTPPSTVAAIRAGYTPGVHPSASD